MRKIILTDEVAQALEKVFVWARMEASTAVATPFIQTIVKAVVDEKDHDEEKIS